MKTNQNTANACTYYDILIIMANNIMYTVQKLRIFV